MKKQQFGYHKVGGYVRPSIEVITAEVEQGFLLSDIGGGSEPEPEDPGNQEPSPWEDM